jgi:hypothetical protein
VPRVIFGTKKGETIKGWRKMQNETLHELQSFTKCWNDQMKEAWMGKAFGMYRAEEKRVQVFSRGTSRKNIICKRMA